MPSREELPGAGLLSPKTTTPVIRKWQMAEITGKQRLLNRYTPALIVSGVLHTVLITAFMLICQALQAQDQPKARPTTNTVIEMAEANPETESEVFNVDLDADSKLAEALEPVKDTELAVDAPVIDNEAVGLPNHEEDFAPRASNVGSMTSDLADPGLMRDDLTGVIGAGKIGAGSDLGRFGMKGNSGLPAEIQKRLDQAGGKSGQIQITLVWNNRNDLDLHCIDPNGEQIFYGNSRAVKGSGGHLDVDRNVSGETMTPIENIYFPQGLAPPGKYRIFVNHFSNQGSADPTSYQLYVKVNDRHLTWKGRISSGKPDHFYEFSLPRKSP